MFRRNVARLGRGMVLTALPVTVWAQWWGPYGAPATLPGLSAPPAPPSVGAFMSNPGSSASITQRAVMGPASSGAQGAAPSGYYVLRPSMFGPPIYVWHPSPRAPGSDAAPTGPTATPPQPAGQAQKEADEPVGTEASGLHHDAAPSTTTIVARQTTAGEILVDADGMSLYVSGGDQAGKSSCYADCAENWPPAAAPMNAESHGELAVITREDGSRQWAYTGQPLYRWAGDRQPGDVTGDGLGGAWAVARTD